MDCLFCRMVSGALATDILYQDDQVMAFADIKAVAPIHYLVIPKRHIATLNALAPTEHNLTGQMIYTATQLAKTASLAESGYRLVMNCNADAGQSVFHIHLHLIGGQPMGWPPFTKSF